MESDFALDLCNVHDLSQSRRLSFWHSCITMYRNTG